MPDFSLFCILLIDPPYDYCEKAVKQIPKNWQGVAAAFRSINNRNAAIVFRLCLFLGAKVQNNYHFSKKMAAAKSKNTTFALKKTSHINSEKMMKILIVNDQHFPLVNGVAWFARNLATGLADRGHEVQVIATSYQKKGHYSTEMDKNHLVHYLPSVQVPVYTAMRISLNPAREIKRIFQNFQPDVIHIQSPLTIGKAAMKYGHKMKIPVITTIHQMSENVLKQIEFLAPISQTLNKIITNYGTHFHAGADFITIPTASAAKIFANTLAKIHKVAKPISNGIDLSKFQPPSPKNSASDQNIFTKFSINSTRKIVLYIGRVDKDKHLSTIVKAFAKIREMKIDADLIIVGTGNDVENLREIAASENLTKNVIFTGFVSEEEKSALARVGTLYAMPSSVELQSISTLEAMASGQPIVAVNAGALAELCHNDKNGFLVDLDDIDQFAKCFAKILSDKKLREKFSKESLRIAKTHDLQNVLTEFENVYREQIESFAKRTKPKK